MVVRLNLAGSFHLFQYTSEFQFSHFNFWTPTIYGLNLEVECINCSVHRVNVIVGLIFLLIAGVIWGTGNKRLFSHLHFLAKSANHKVR